MQRSVIEFPYFSIFGFPIVLLSVEPIAHFRCNPNTLGCAVQLQDGPAFVTTCTAPDIQDCVSLNGYQDPDDTDSQTAWR